MLHLNRTPLYNSGIAVCKLKMLQLEHYFHFEFADFEIKGNKDIYFFIAVKSKPFLEVINRNHHRGVKNFKEKIILQ